MSFLPKSDHILPIAIDIGHSCVKMLQLMLTKDTLHCVAAAKFAIPSHLRRDSERQRAVTDGIKNALAEQPFRGRRVATIVPNEAIKYKSFRLPQMPEEELDNVVQFEAEERFAFPDPEAEYRFVHAGQVRQGQEVREEIIAMGCPSDALRNYLDIFDDLGLACDGMEASPYAMVRPFMKTAQHTEPSEEVAQVFIDVGHRASRLAITRAGQIIFIKSIAVGGSRFEELTAMKLNLSGEEAAQLRQEVLSAYAETDGEDDPRLNTEIIEAAQEAIKPAVEQLGKEIGLCLRYYSVTFRGIRPEELTCFGGESYDPHVLKSITEITGVSTVQGLPLKRVGTADVFSGAERRSGLLEWSTVTGLAMRELHTRIREKVVS